MRAYIRNFLRNVQALFTQPLYRHERYLRNDIEGLRSDWSIQNRINRSLFERLDQTKEGIDLIYEGLGGQIWRTQAGHARFLALLSTEHLQNILGWPGTQAKTIHLVRQELERRAIDYDFRSAEGQARADAQAQACGGKVRKAYRVSDTESIARVLKRNGPAIRDALNRVVRNKPLRKPAKRKSK